MALSLFASTGSAAPAGSTFLVSRPAGTVVAPTDNSSSGPLAVSSDGGFTGGGRYVAFMSTADGFAPGANPTVNNLFVRDTTTNTTTLVSRSDGINGAGVNASVQTSEERIGIVVEAGSEVADAPHDQPHVLVVFSTAATNLVDHATNSIPATGGNIEVWMRDVTAGTTYLVSRASDGAPANGAPATGGRSHQPSIAASPGGPMVAFASEATNLGRFGLGPGGVYLREMKEGVTHLVSCARQQCRGGATALGFSSEPSLQIVTGTKATDFCPEGAGCEMVAFVTGDPTIAEGASESDKQVVVGLARLRSSGEFENWRTASTVSGHPNTVGNSSSREPTMSADGLSVVFVSDATNLGPFGPSPSGEGYHYFSENTNSTFVATLNPPPSISTCCIPLSGGVTHLAAGGPAAEEIVFDSTTHELGAPFESFPLVRSYEESFPRAVVLDSVAGAGGAVGNAESKEAAIGADGHAMAFVSRSTNLGTGGGTDFSRVYKRVSERAGAETLQLVSRPSGTGSFSPGSKRSGVSPDAISSDGRFVAFESNANDLSSADDDRFTNLFVRDTVNGTTTLVSRADGADGVGADKNSTLNGISDDGHRVLFTTEADNFGTPGQPGPHAYVRDLSAQTTTVITRGSGLLADSVVPGEGTSISGNGNRVAFTTNLLLDAEATAGKHLYVRDLSAGTTTWVDRANGVFGGPASNPGHASLDRDGGRIAWEGENAPDLGGPFNVAEIYVRDLAAHTTVLASATDGAGGEAGSKNSEWPAIDAAGDAVAFETFGPSLGSDAQLTVWIRRLASNHTELVSRASGANGAPANQVAFGPVSIDAAGDRVTFRSAASNLDAAAAGNTELYMRDFSANTTEAVNRVDGAGGAVASPSLVGIASISASGDCVAFSSTGLNFTDPLASADFAQVRERVLRGNCGPSKVTNAEAPAPNSPPPPAVAALSKLEMQPTRFYVGAGGGTQVSFMLSQPTPVTLTFDRQVVAAGSAKLSLRRVGRLTVKGRAGKNTIHFSGRLHGRALTPGGYRWAATTADGGSAASGHFVVLKPPRAG